MEQQVEALKTISNMCSIIFDNEDAFCKEFKIKIDHWDDFKNVSFSGKMCHITVSNVRRTRHYYVANDKVLTWMKGLGEIK